jgi:hypothetical protein
MTDDKLTAALGWASVGLGVPLLSAAGEVARVIGIEDGSRQRRILTGVGAGGNWRNCPPSWPTSTASR